MKNTDLIKLNELSNAAIERGIAELGERLGDGANLMGLLMNPKKAGKEFGGAFQQLVTGINGQRQVIAELLRREVEGVSNE